MKDLFSKEKETYIPMKISFNQLLTVAVYILNKSNRNI